MQFPIEAPFWISIFNGMTFEKCPLANGMTIRNSVTPTCFLGHTSIMSTHMEDCQ
jgi:hypothetical protein